MRQVLYLVSAMLAGVSLLICKNGLLRPVLSVRLSIAASPQSLSKRSQCRPSESRAARMPGFSFPFRRPGREFGRLLRVLEAGIPGRQSGYGLTNGVVSIANDIVEGGHRAYR